MYDIYTCIEHVGIYLAVSTSAAFISWSRWPTVYETLSITLTITTITITTIIITISTITII